MASGWHRTFLTNIVKFKVEGAPGGWSKQTFYANIASSHEPLSSLFSTNLWLHFYFWLHARLYTSALPFHLFLSGLHPPPFSCLSNYALLSFNFLLQLLLFIIYLLSFILLIHLIINLREALPTHHCMSPPFHGRFHKCAYQLSIPPCASTSTTPTPPLCPSKAHQSFLTTVSFCESPIARSHVVSYF